MVSCGHKEGVEAGWEGLGEAIVAGLSIGSLSWRAEKPTESAPRPHDAGISRNVLELSMVPISAYWLPARPPGCGDLAGMAITAHGPPI